MSKIKEDSIQNPYMRAKEDKEKTKEFKSKVYKYAVVIYREKPAILIRNVHDSNFDLQLIYMFKNLEKRKKFLKLHKDSFEEKEIYLARIDRRKNLTYENK